MHCIITQLTEPYLRRSQSKGEPPILVVDLLVEHKVKTNADGAESIAVSLDITGAERDQFDAGTLTLQQIITAHAEELEGQLEAMIAKADEVRAAALEAKSAEPSFTPVVIS